MSELSELWEVPQCFRPFLCSSEWAGECQGLAVPALLCFHKLWAEASVPRECTTHLYLTSEVLGEGEGADHWRFHHCVSQQLAQ